MNYSEALTILNSIGYEFNRTSNLEIANRWNEGVGKAPGPWSFSIEKGLDFNQEEIEYRENETKFRLTLVLTSGLLTLRVKIDTESYRRNANSLFWDMEAVIEGDEMPLFRSLGTGSCGLLRPAGAIVSTILRYALTPDSAELLNRYRKEVEEVSEYRAKVREAGEIASSGIEGARFYDERVRTASGAPGCNRVEIPYKRIKAGCCMYSSPQVLRDGVTFSALSVTPEIANQILRLITDE